MSLSESVRFRPITVPLPVFSVRYHLNFPLPQILSVTTWSFRYHRFRLLPFEFSVTTKFCPLPQFVQFKHSCAKHSLEIRGPIGPQSSSVIEEYYLEPISINKSLWYHQIQISWMLIWTGSFMILFWNISFIYLKEISGWLVMMSPSTSNVICFVHLGFFKDTL